MADDDLAQLKAQIFDLYDEGEVSETAARRLLGDEAFEDGLEMTRGAEMMLSGDPERFMSNDDD